MPYGIKREVGNAIFNTKSNAVLLIFAVYGCLLTAVALYACPEAITVR